MALRTLQLPARCPQLRNDRESCTRCIQARLGGRQGIRQFRLHCAPDCGQAVLELDYDPRLITLTELENEVKDAGLCLTPQRVVMVLGIEGMISPRSEEIIESILARLPGVASSASFASRSLRVEFDRQQCALPEIARLLDRAGFRISGPPVSRHGEHAGEKLPAESRLHKARRLVLEHHKIVMALVGGILLIGAWLTHLYQGPAGLRLGLIVAAYLLTGWYTFIDTVWVLRELRFDIDVLMFAAAFGAASLGHYEEGGLLLFLFALGGAGEELAMDRARRAISALAKLAPETAIVRDDDGKEREVRVEDLQRGQRIVIRPFDRVPADGSVISGASAVDQAPITGESVPVEKVAGDAVFAGTINGEGLLVASVTKLSSESTLARIVTMVNEAQTTKSPTQVFTDKVEKWYVPLVLVGTTALIFLPPLLGAGLWATWFYRAMAFLTAASPCALAIGTPAAVLSGIARAARGGVLIKGGVHLENLGKVRALAFDKTGTLTRGRPELMDIIPIGMQEDQLLSLAAAVERGSTHPLAKAIVGEATARHLPELPASDVEQVPAMGVRARVDDAAIAVGHLNLLPADAPERAQVQATIDRLASEGKTTVIIVRNGHAIGVIGLADRPRLNAADTLAHLKQLGLERTIMLTGDNPTVAAAIARQVGIDEFHASLLPEDKVSIVKTLSGRYGRVAMVGDGVNDAPALANASVGIAMGGAGTDVALETADVALMADDLGKLPEAIGISRFSRRIIIQNLVIALGVIAVLAPTAALGGTKLGIAVLFHEGSTVVVVLNSLRLLLYRSRRKSAATGGAAADSKPVEQPALVPSAEAVADNDG